MKKENRVMAQQRRAEERKKKEFRKKISKVFAVLIPFAVLAVLIAVLVIFTDTGSQSGSTSSDSSSSASADAQDASDSGYSTDSSLTVEDGNTVNIDYVGSVDGVEFSGGNTNGAGTDLVIGSGSYIDDFEEQLIGCHPGDTVDVYVTFPDPYDNNTDLSGKEALFEVTINGIYEQETASD